MMRFFIFFLKLLVLMGIALWIVQTPGDVIIEWRGFRIHTSFGLFIGGMFLLSALLSFFYMSGQFFLRLPKRVIRAYELRKFKKGYKILVDAMCSLFGQETDVSMEMAHKLQTLLPSPVIGLWIEAFVTQKKNDDDKARKLYLKLKQKKEGNFLGLYGLITLALKEKDYAQAKTLAESLYKIRSGSPWVAYTLFDLYVRDEQFEMAGLVLDQIKPASSEERLRKNNLKALLWYKRANVQDLSRTEKLELLSYSNEFSPTFIPTACLYASLLNDVGKRSKALKVIERAWSASPEISLAHAYLACTPLRDSLEAYQMAVHLLELTPTSDVAQLIVLEAALKASLWGEARVHLESVSEKNKTAFYYELKAQLLEQESNDIEGARECRQKALSLLMA